MVREVLVTKAQVKCAYSIRIHFHPFR
jgi:hypothetical protein